MLIALLSFVQGRANGGGEVEFSERLLNDYCPVARKSMIVEGVFRITGHKYASDRRVAAANFGRELGRLRERKEVHLGADLAIFREVSSGLTHEPQRGSRQ